MENILSRETTPKARPSSLARSQSSRQNRPPRAVHAHMAGRGGSILGNGDYNNEEMGGMFSRAKHTSLSSFDSIGGSFRAAPLMEQATAFESGMKNTQYRIWQKIFARQKFHQPQLPLYYRNIWWNKFHQCGKGRHILNVIINMGQKIRAIKISPMRADGEIGKNFLLVKISTYTVLIFSTLPCLDSGRPSSIVMLHKKSTACNI